MPNREVGTTKDAPTRIPRRIAGQRGHAPSRPAVKQRAALLPERAISPVWEALRGEGELPEGSSDRVVLRRDAAFRRALAVVDVIATGLALVVALAVIGGGDAKLELPALILPPLVVLCCKAIGLYDRDQHLLRKTTIDEAPQILHFSVLFALLVWLGEGFLVDGPLNRAEVFGLAFASLGFLLVGRTAARAVALARTPVERCVVLGGADSAARIAAKLEHAPAVKAVVIGRVGLDESRGSANGGPPLLGDMNSLVLTLADNEVERVIIAPDEHDQEQILHAIRLIKALGVKVSVLPRLLEVVGSSATYDDIDGITLLGVRQYGLTHSSEILKRGMDLVGAAVALLVFAPLLTALAVAIKLDSRGPVFFRQRRIGRSGEEFFMFKFRSMVRGAENMKDELRERNEAEGLFKIEDDPRITRVGRFLRRTSLDELPQLINVLKGDMSLVGPRPLVPDEDALIEGWQRRRLAVKPGMTGLWQIFGSARIPMHEMVKIDYLYGANWSVWLDLKILFRTIPYVLRWRRL